jgi:hypothetical protein
MRHKLASFRLQPNTDREDAAEATTARGFRPPNDDKPSSCSSKPSRLTRPSKAVISPAKTSSTSPMNRSVR